MKIAARILMFALSLSLVACAKPVNKATLGGLTGAGLGAGTGAIIGSQSGKAGAGIAIGAGLGALAGAAFGNTLDSQDNQREQTREEIRQNDEILRENQRLIEELRGRGADVRDSKRGVVVNLPDVLFEFNSDVLSPYASDTIGQIGEVLKGVSGRTIAVEGHTDSIGTVQYNKDLSQRRARSVSNALQREGIPSGQMEVRGYGEGSPIATNNTDAGRARNRRVEVIIEN